MNFSQRMGLEPVTMPFQTDSMNDALRVGLWNVFNSYVIDPEGEVAWHIPTSPRELTMYKLCQRLWLWFFKYPIDTLPGDAYEVREFLRKWFFQASWDKVYCFIEFVPLNHGHIDANKFRDVCNFVLKKEWSAYRFVGEELAPMTNETEIKAIEDAAAHDSSKLKPVTDHIRLAVAAIAKKPEADYRTSMKESISSVEALCKILADKPDATLSNALDPIKNGLGMNNKLHEGLKLLYGYTSDAGGIRHSFKPKNDEPPDQEDAMFMLVSCSAFVNFMVAKAKKVGMLT